MEQAVPMKEIEKPWIKSGYRLFACEGPNGLKIERLSKDVGKNKSSFYHLFADLDIFTVKLLAFHLDQAKIIAAKESMSHNESELIQVILEHKTDLLFNRQLRVQRENKDFEHCFIQVNEISLPAVLPVWKKIIGISENTILAKMVLTLSLENFYLQITEKTLNASWLEAYFAGIREMVLHFKNVEKMRSMDGSV